MPNGNPLIVVLDDDSAELSVIISRLRGKGYETHAFKNEMEHPAAEGGKSFMEDIEALVKAGRAPEAVVIKVHNADDLDAFSTMAALNQRYPDVPVVAISSDGAAQREFMDCGFKNAQYVHLAKGNDIHALLDKLSELTGYERGRDAGGSLVSI